MPSAMSILYYIAACQWDGMLTAAQCGRTQGVLYMCETLVRSGLAHV